MFKFLCRSCKTELAHGDNLQAFRRSGAVIECKKINCSAVNFAKNHFVIGSILYRHGILLKTDVKNLQNRQPVLR